MKGYNKSKNELINEINDMQNELGMLKTVMAQYEVAEKSLQSRLDNMSRVLDQTINALAVAIEMRDPYTAMHQRRVTELACGIAAELDLNLEMTKGLKVAAALHDIGKISIPLDILIKPGRLTDLEYSLIKEHSRAGYNVLKEIRFPWPVAQIVHQHHERIDGSGYPAGLKCSDILVEAKIIAVADVVEAMSSRRPYRAFLGLDAAREEIMNHRGALYDPDVVDACLKVLSQGRFAVL